MNLGSEEKLYLGNIDALRDWGHARDYVEGMWRMLQQDEPDDYVLATGEQHSVREFVELSFAEIDRKIVWQGSGVDEQGIDEANGDVLVEIDPRYFRPTEVETLLGNPAKALDILGWQHTTPFSDLVSDMVKSDLELLKRGDDGRD
jgi:GDPmannose 4,6-dehydratase